MRVWGDVVCGVGGGGRASKNGAAVENREVVSKLWHVFEKGGGGYRARKALLWRTQR